MRNDPARKRASPDVPSARRFDHERGDGERREADEERFEADRDRRDVLVPVLACGEGAAGADDARQRHERRHCRFYGS